MLALLFTLAANTAGSPGPAPTAPADGTYTYVSAVNGATVGKTAITVKRNADGIVLTESGGGNYEGQSGTIADTLNLDSTLAPSAYSATASFGGRTTKSTLAFKGATVSETGDAGTKTYDLAAQAKHFVVLDLGPFSGWFALPAQMTAWNNTPAIAIVPTMAQGIPITPSASTTASRPKGVPAADISIGVTTPMPFTMWYDPNTLVVDELEFPSQGVTITRES
jgi:hypothetical protein